MNSNLDSIGDGEVWEFRLYVAGQTAKSVAAYKNLLKICDAHLPSRYKIDVVDLLTSPLVAREDRIIAIPTLVRKSPPPTQKIVGDLSNTDQVLLRLQLQPTDQVYGHGEEQRDRRSVE